AADLEILVEREDESHRGAEEFEVAAALALRSLEVPLPDAEEAIKVPADLAPPREEGLAPVLRVVVPLAPVRGLPVAVERFEDRRAKAVTRFARDDAHLPGLDVGAARRARGK